MNELTDFLNTHTLSSSEKATIQALHCGYERLNLVGHLIALVVCMAGVLTGAVMAHNAGANAEPMWIIPILAGFAPAVAIKWGLEVKRAALPEVLREFLTAEDEEAQRIPGAYPSH